MCGLTINELNLLYRLSGREAEMKKVHDGRDRSYA